VVDSAAWLSGSCLLLIGDLGRAPGEPRVSLDSDRGSIQLKSLRFPVSRTSPAGEDGEEGGIIVVFPEGAPIGEGDAVLTVGTGDEAIRLLQRDLEQVTSDLQALLRRALAPLDADARTEVIALFASMLSVVPEPDRRELSNRLFGVREALRERLPRPVLSSSTARGAHVDQLLAVDERSFHVEGWVHHEAVPVVRLTAVSPEGSRVELIDRLFRYPRPDVARFLSSNLASSDEPGFVCFFELDGPSLRPEGWIFEIESEDGLAQEVPASLLATGALDTRDAILGGPYIDKTPSEELMSDHIVPAVGRIQDRLHSGAKIESVTQVGTPPPSPDISIVVPLEGALGLLEVQLSQFAGDPELLEETDLIYVVSAPEAEEALQYAADIFPIYQVPSRVAVTKPNLGLAGAARAGHEVARGRLLILMEPDVVPSGPGWPGRLRSFYDATPSIGALGPKLLFEDDSIQHAGQYFYRRPGSPLWRQGVHFKGLHRRLPAANRACPVAAVSPACMMVDRGLFERAGGLPPIYVGDEYEVLDLCLQLAGGGLENWYLPDVELYHAEPRLDEANGAMASERYDEWLYDHRWSERIASLTDDVRPAEGVAES
jgi:GT2 family glycosyltransferase